MTKKHGSGQKFWNREYQRGGHLALSDEPSEDLIAFTRWMERELGRVFLNPLSSALDLGCGNGRNLIYLSKTYGIRGVGFDISSEAISQAKKAGKELPLSFHVGSIAHPLPVPDASQTFVLDMMTSHVLRAEERTRLLAEIVRVLRPDGWLLWKTFLSDEDAHVKRLLQEHPADEPGSYIHPEIGVLEHVVSEQEVEEFLSPHFYIHKVHKSHRHTKAAGGKRRSIVIYAQKT